MRPLAKWGALVAIVSIAPLAFVAAIYLQKPPNRLNEAISAIGFHPITPPMLLRAPGSIYHVSANGRDYDMLCEVSPDRLVGVTRSSASTTQVTSELRRAQYALDSKIVHSIQSRTDAKLAESLRLELDDVQVLEISLEELAIIADELFQRESCDREVRRYLENGEYVCQGQRVLKASTRYVAAYDNTAAGSVQHTTDLIRNHFDPTVSVQGGQSVSGANLYFGMRLAPRCLSFKDAKRQPRPPLSLWNRLVNHFPSLEFL
ncbi:hypothetical protein GA0061099_1005416 [Bradyrhizobium yuanmingense]|uniref:Uncharacterized protein n=1 Tax=Bradyrhizobium yuanmingense TaxID=108015 RepID=A0A1C3W7U1_9BRAD|nr:hypothetical protein IQ15_02908 [Bradyrhizobium yuanmingense]SCB36050.1 hypothetical protein GA0061099_1005416 [Bradyrhizobium yuanmingense]